MSAYVWNLTVTRRNFGDIAAFAKGDRIAKALTQIGEAREQRSGGRRAGSFRRGLLVFPWEKDAVD